MKLLFLIFKIFLLVYPASRVEAESSSATMDIIMRVVPSCVTELRRQPDVAAGRDWSPSTSCEGRVLPPVIIKDVRKVTKGLGGKDSPGQQPLPGPIVTSDSTRTSYEVQGPEQDSATTEVVVYTITY